jgi:hypothetical protein
MKQIRKTTLYLVALAITIRLMSFKAQPVSAAVASPEKCTRWHTVKSGEHLSRIAEQYDTNWYSIAQLNQLTNPSLIFAGNQLCIFSSDFSSNPPTFTPTSTTSGNLAASSVKEDQSVTLQGKNLAADTRYEIFLGKFKTDPAIRFSVGSVLTDKNGVFQKTVTIPKKLYDVLKIRASITSPRGTTTSNWFINTTGSGNVGGSGAPALSIDISSVKKAKWVKFVTENLPADVQFKVYMSKPGAPMKKAILVGTLSDPKGKDVTASFDIPGSLKDLAKLEVFLVNDALEMNAEAEFDNRTT